MAQQVVTIPSRIPSPAALSPTLSLPGVRLNVGVTGLNATDNPGPGISVIRSLRHANGFSGRVVGFGYDTLDPGIYAGDLLDAAYLLPFPGEGPDALFDRLCSIQEQTGLDAILPTLDAEIPVFIDIADRLAAIGIHTYLPSRAQFDMRGKENLKALGATAGVRVPDYTLIYRQEELYRLEKELAYPVVVKGPLYDARVAHSFQDLLQAFHRIHASWGLPVIVQQFIEGQEYDVAAVGDGTGNIVGAIPMKKMFLTEKGKGWVGVAVHDGRLLEMTERLVRELRWKGPCEIEVIREKHTGDYYLLEVNPRFPAWIYLSAGAGINLPYAALLLAAGMDLKPMKGFRAGTMFVRIAIEQIAHVDDLAQIASTGELLHNLTGIDDPVDAVPERPFDGSLRVADAV